MVLNRRILRVMAVILGILVVVVLSLSTSALLAEEAPECTITVQPGESIQAAIERAPEGAVICLPVGIWEENIKIEKSLTLRGRGQEQSVIKGKEEGSVIWIKHDSEIEVKIEDFTVAEAKVSKEPPFGGHGIVIGGKAKVMVKNCWISDNGGIAISIEGLAKATIVDNVVKNNKGAYFNGVAVINVGIISVVGLANATIQGNEISSNGIDGINIGTIYIGTSANATVQDNRISDNGGHGIKVRGSGQATIQDNEIFDNYFDGIHMEDSANATIQDNKISGNGIDGIHMRDSAKVTIIGNEISNNDDNGVLLWNLTNAIIRKNEISGNRLAGIRLRNSAQAEITDITDLVRRELASYL